MPNVFRPTPQRSGLRRHVLHGASTSNGRLSIVLNHFGDIDSHASETVSRMAEGGLAEQTVPGYARGFLSVLDELAITSMETAAGSFSPWINPADVISVAKDCIRRLGGTLEESTDEPGVYQVTVEDENKHPGVVAAICGLFHAFDSAVKLGIYHWSNPFEIPLADRKPRRISGGPAGFTVLPRFRFRLPAAEGSPLRTDPSDHVTKVVPALVAAGAPGSVIMMIKLMIEGLARIAEQIRISLWDWWNASGFGNLVDTTSKGSRRKRVKQQAITDELVAELTRFANEERALLDRNGWTLEDWRRFLTDTTKSVKERRVAAKQAPLFPARHGGFYSRSGVVDNWYRPAMKDAGLPTRTHYLRHSGVNDFLAYADARDDLTPEQKDAAKLEFGKALGWRWPEAMLARYSLPARKAAQVIAANEWLIDRRVKQEALAAGIGRAPPASRPTNSDLQLSRLVRFSVERKAA